MRVTTDQTNKQTLLPDFSHAINSLLTYLLTYQCLEICIPRNTNSSIHFRAAHWLAGEFIDRSPWYGQFQCGAPPHTMATGHATCQKDKNITNTKFIQWVMFSINFCLPKLLSYNTRPWHHNFSLIEQSTDVNHRDFLFFHTHVRPYINMRTEHSFIDIYSTLLRVSFLLSIVELRLWTLNKPISNLIWTRV